MYYLFKDDDGVREMEDVLSILCILGKSWQAFKGQIYI